MKYSKETEYTKLTEKQKIKTRCTKGKQIQIKCNKDIEERQKDNQENENYIEKKAKMVREKVEMKGREGRNNIYTIGVCGRERILEQKCLKS